MATDAQSYSFGSQDSDSDSELDVPMAKPWRPGMVADLLRMLPRLVGLNHNLVNGAATLAINGSVLPIDNLPARRRLRINGAAVSGLESSLAGRSALVANGRSHAKVPLQLSMDKNVVAPCSEPRRPPARPAVRGGCCRRYAEMRAPCLRGDSGDCIGGPSSVSQNSAHWLCRSQRGLLQAQEAGVVRQAASARLDQDVLKRREHWLKSIIEWQREFVDSLTAREFVDGITDDLLGRGVFVFTPSGDLMRLPKVPRPPSTACCSPAPESALIPSCLHRAFRDCFLLAAVCVGACVWGLPSQTQRSQPAGPLPLWASFVFAPELFIFCRIRRRSTLPTTCTPTWATRWSEPRSTASWWRPSGRWPTQRWSRS